MWDLFKRDGVTLTIAALGIHRLPPGHCFSVDFQTTSQWQATLRLEETSVSE
jgi:hypothetical protein